MQSKELFEERPVLALAWADGLPLGFPEATFCLASASVPLGVFWAFASFNILDLGFMFVVVKVF